MSLAFCAPFFRIGCRTGLGGMLVLLAVFATGKASACSTPVYRYAMLNWATAPYHVFYFHQDGEADEDRDVNRELRELEGAWPAAAFKFIEIDAARHEQTGRLDVLVERAWRRHGAAAPLHLVMTSWGAELFAGRLASENLQAILDSPLRQRLAGLLDEGNAAVLVFVPGKEEKESRRVENLLEALIDRVDRGDVAPSTARGTTGPDPTPEASPEAAASPGPASLAPPKLASLSLLRDDQAETWLLRQLMAVEPDLVEYVDEPMVFAVYGRGRAMPPWIGGGINRENLEDGVSFLLGDCSCLVKEQNPGRDLLVRWDWEATADKLANETGDLLEEPLVYEELVPTTALAAASEDLATKNDPAIAPGAEPGNAGGSDAEDASTFGARQSRAFGVGLGVLGVVVVFLGLIWARTRTF